MVSMTHISTSSEGICRADAMVEYGTERVGVEAEIVASVNNLIFVVRTVDEDSSMERLERGFVSRKSA